MPEVHGLQLSQAMPPRGIAPGGPPPMYEVLAPQYVENRGVGQYGTFEPERNLGWASLVALAISAGLKYHERKAQKRAKKKARRRAARAAAAEERRLAIEARRAEAEARAAEALERKRPKPAALIPGLPALPWYAWAGGAVASLVLLFFAFGGGAAAPRRRIRRRRARAA